jgi:hypothetical protein
MKIAFYLIVTIIDNTLMTPMEPSPRCEADTAFFTSVKKKKMKGKAEGRQGTGHQHESVSEKDWIILAPNFSNA